MSYRTFDAFVDFLSEFFPTVPKGEGHTGELVTDAWDLLTDAGLTDVSWVEAALYGEAWAHSKTVLARNQQSLALILDRTFAKLGWQPRVSELHSDIVAAVDAQRVELRRRRESELDCMFAGVR